MRLTLNGTNRRGKDNCAKFQRMRGRRVRIWSGQWRLYWRPDAAGYTSDLSEAGIYDFGDAYARTKHCGPEKRIEYRPTTDAAG